MITDPVADLLTRIRNAQRAGHDKVSVPQSKMSKRILQVLKDEGFIANFSTSRGSDDFSPLIVNLRYYPNGRPMIVECKRISKSGRRIYSTTKELPSVLSGLGISIVSTSQGVMSDREARRRQIGGEVLAAVC
jgi:small subunit ribosomal protein S8